MTEQATCHYRAGDKWAFNDASIPAMTFGFCPVCGKRLDADGTETRMVSAVASEAVQATPFFRQLEWAEHQGLKTTSCNAKDRPIILAALSQQPQPVTSEAVEALLLVQLLRDAQPGPYYEVIGADPYGEEVFCAARDLGLISLGEAMYDPHGDGGEHQYIARTTERGVLLLAALAAVGAEPGEPESLPERVRREATLAPGEVNPLQAMAGACPDFPLPEEGPSETVPADLKEVLSEALRLAVAELHEHDGTAAMYACQAHLAPRIAVEPRCLEFIAKARAIIAARQPAPGEEPEEADRAHQ